LPLNADSYFYLYELEDPILNNILKLPPKELDNYIYALICRFYSEVVLDSDEYNKLETAYKASFILEKLYRTNELLLENFTAIYTKTGLLRELVLDLYEIDAQKVAIH
jgi:hypothetical protein